MASTPGSGSRFKLQFKIIPASIDSIHKILTIFGQELFEATDSVMRGRYDLIFRRTRGRCMVATGESKEKIFVNKLRTLFGGHYICGFGSTTNDQSSAMEFQTGPVHRKKASHFTDLGSPKCSRKPEDLYSMRGSIYNVNRRARRRPLASSIEDGLFTKVTSAFNTGSNLRYEPSLFGITQRLIGIAKAFTRTLGST